jgi:soluble lytic murein transglycosylase-like protein
VPGLPRVHWRGGGYEDADPPEPQLESHTARSEQHRIDRDIQNGQPDRALNHLKRLALDKNVPISDLAHLAQHVSASYLAEGDDDQAFALSASVANSARDIEPRLDWSAGLAAFRLGRFADAAKHFDILSRSRQMPSWTRAASAFWAARSFMRAGDIKPVIPLLEAAARQEPTFYGLLAERILGEQPDATFHNAVLTVRGFETLMRVPAIHRAVALWQVGRKDDVVNEMTRAFGHLRRTDGAAFAALAKDLVLPNLELRASETEAARGIMLTGLFPIPRYKPHGGYRVDPSVILAIARIESRFKSNAVSHVGARGLMQLMPATARHLAGHRISHSQLEDPTYNLALGQRYIKRLLRQVDGNLFELAVAYNAGPANLSRWLSERTGTKDDPLLFIESVPSPETRSYIKRFMMYHWLYRRRLDQDSPTLDEAAAGNWPLYQPQTVPVASAPAALQSFDAAAAD